MQESVKEKLEISIKNLDEKKSRIYFLVQDTKNNAKASVRYIYQIAKTLLDNGFNPIILHEKKDYMGVKWMGEEYMNIPHKTIEGENLEISPEDFLVIPEIFGYVMDQVKQLPCSKIVLTQQYAYMLETLNPGQSWSQFGFFKCITTNPKQKEYIEKVMRQASIDVLKPYISENFYPKNLPPMPIIGIHTKEQSDAINIIKTFYLKFPQYRWFTFRDLRGLSEVEFASSLRDCFMSVWIDDKTGFGTFPLESTIKSDYTWMRASRKGWHMDAVMPGMKVDPMIDIAVALDASGSISEKMLKDFLGEIQGIMDSFPAYRIHVFTFDTEAYNPAQYDSDNLDDICDYEVKGGGGTDFDAIYSYLKENEIEPKRLVVFTDGYTFGSWGDENYADTVWILHGTTTIVPPWGQFAYYDEAE